MNLETNSKKSHFIEKLENKLRQTKANRKTMTQTRTKAVQSIYLMPLLFIFLFIPSHLHAQDDDDLHFKVSKGKIQLKKDQFYYVSGDTITFFADAFVLPEGAMLDRLLRKLPGVEYLSNSNIIIDGTTVKEMRVEGKEYFKNVMTSVVKRIPAYCIDQVKFYDYDQGKRMNIIIKKKYKGKWFAEFSAGLGPDGRYSEKAFAMTYGKKLRMTVFANANDINDTRQPGQETEWSPASMAKNEVNSQSGGLEYMWKKKNQDMIGYATVSRSVTDATTAQDKTNLMLSGDTYQQTNSVSRKRSLKINTYHDYHLRKGNLDFHVKPKFTYDDTHNTSSKNGFLAMAADSTLVNRSKSGTETESNTYNANLIASMSYKFDHKKKQVKYEMSGTTKGGKQNDLTDETIHYFNLDHDSTYQYSQYLHTSPKKEAEYYLKGEYQWTGKGLLGVLQYKFKHNYLHEAMEESVLSINSYNSREQRDTHEMVLKLHYERPTHIGTWTLNVFAPLDIVSSHIDYQRSDYSRKLHRNYTTFDLKNTYLQWRSRDTQQRITLFYDISTTLPDAEMLQDVTNTLDKQNYYFGNPSLKNQTTHQVRLKYLRLSLDTRKEFSVMLKQSMVSNAIVTRTSYDQATGRKLYIYDNVDGNRTTTATLTYGTPLNKANTLYLHNKLESGLNHKVSLDETKGDVAKKEADVYTVDDDLRLKWLIAKKQTLTLRTRFQLSYSDNNGSITKPIDWTCGLLGQFQLPWKLDLATDFMMYKRQNYTSLELNTTDWVCNARLVRPFLHDRLLIVLEGFDIFHQLKNITHTVTSDVITNTRTNVIPSYAMLCVVYRLNYKKVSNKDKVHWF